MLTATLTATAFPLLPNLSTSSSSSSSSSVLQTPKFHPFRLRTHDHGSLGVRRWVVAASSTQSQSGSLSSPSPGLYSTKVFDLTPENVDLVLEDVRPYLISDGGNVGVVGVEDGVVSLKLQGACGSCPSSTTTMKMGIERVLKENFGEAIKEIRQVFDELQDTISVEAVNNHLDILRPAIKNYGGIVEVVSVDGGDCHVKYVGPESIGSGIKAAIKEKFPEISNVTFVD